MKYSATRIILSALITLSILNCTKDDDPEISNLPEKFPLSVGNKWDYNRTIKLMYKPDSTAVGMNTAYTDSTIELSYIFSEAQKDTVLEDTIPVVMVKSEEIPVNGKQDSWENTEFYANREDGLYKYSYIDLKNKNPETKPKIIFKGIQFDSIEDLKALLKLNSLPEDIKSGKSYKSSRVIQYPIETGNVWDYGSISYILTTEREITGTSFIVTPAGEFDCYEIHTYWDWGADGEWDDDIKSVTYLSEYGFVKTDYEIWNLCKTDEYGTNLGYYDYFEEEVLTDYDVDLE